MSASHGANARWFPPISDYVLSHPCPTCNAKPWEPCAAPKKQARAARWRSYREQAGQPPAAEFAAGDINQQHATRATAGVNHHHRDLAKAPWAEDRVPGTDYGTVDYTGRATR